MKTRIIYFIAGILTTILVVSLFNHYAPKTLSTEDYTARYSINEETGSSARIMEADVVYFDTDGDGEVENVLLYSCQGCNAPPREIAIIDDGELVFFYEGGNMEFIPVEPGVFIVDEANVPRDGRRIKTTYQYQPATTSYEPVTR